MGRKKYNDESDMFADWTTKKLKQEAKYYDSLIYSSVIGHGMSDIRMLDGILDELSNRGIEPHNNLQF